MELPDIGPTLADLAGVKLDYQHFARSVAPCLADPSYRHRTDALGEYDGEAVLLTEEWKLAVNASGEPYLLFHRPSDPDEQRNLVADPAHRAVVQALQARLLERLVTSQLRLDRQYQVAEVRVHLVAPLPDGRVLPSPQRAGP